MFIFLNKLSAIDKVRFLLGGGTLLLIFAWQFSISKTWSLYHEKLLNEVKLGAALTAPQQVMALRDEVSTLNINSTLFCPTREVLFETINQFCQNNNLLLVNFFPETKTGKDHFQIITTQFQVQGNYKDVLKLSYLLEQQKTSGHISSLNFVLKEDLRLHKSFLTASIFLQQLLPEVQK